MHGRNFLVLNKLTVFQPVFNGLFNGGSVMLKKY